MLQVTLPSDVAAIGEPLPIAEAVADAGTHLVLVIEENGHETLKIVQVSEGGFTSATPNYYPIDDPRIRGFFPIVGRKGVNTVARPIFKVNDKVEIKHQKTLGPHVLVERCSLTDVEYMDGGVLTRVGFYVRVKARKGNPMGYHESSLTLLPQMQYAPEAA